MKDLLCHKDLYAPLESDDANPKDTSNGEWKKLDMVVRFIQQWLDDTILHYVSTKILAHFLWKKLVFLKEKVCAIRHS